MAVPTQTGQSVKTYAPADECQPSLLLCIQQGFPVCCLAVPDKATTSRAAVSARMSDMTTQTTEAQERYVLTSDANGITTYDIVGECVPTLAEIEEWVAPRLRELGVG